METNRHKPWPSRVAGLSAARLALVLGPGSLSWIAEVHQSSLPSFVTGAALLPILCALPTAAVISPLLGFSRDPGPPAIEEVTSPLVLSALCLVYKSSLPSIFTASRSQERWPVP